jgi:ankyrin repeat protein
MMDQEIDGELFRSLDERPPDPRRIRQLIERGANVNAKDKDGYSVLWHSLAIGHAQRAIIELLVEGGANIDQEKDVLLGDACVHAPLSDVAFEVIVYLLRLGANPNLVVYENTLLPLDFVEHFCSCYAKWCEEGREGYSEALEYMSAIATLLRDAGAKRASELATEGFSRDLLKP